MDTYPMVRTTVKAVGSAVEAIRRRWDVPNTTAVVDTMLFKRSLSEAIEVSLAHAHKDGFPVALKSRGIGKLVEFTLEFYPNNPELGVEVTLEGDL
jgi:hypothetical protein